MSKIKTLTRKHLSNHLNKNALMIFTCLMMSLLIFSPSFILHSSAKSSLNSFSANFQSNIDSVSPLALTTCSDINFSNASFSTGPSPYSVAIGDIDGDGKPDLAIANLFDSTVSVLRNTSTIGNVNFAPQLILSTGVDPVSVAIGDLDGDGKLDLAIANFDSGTVSVLRNTSTSGTINFATKVDFTTGNLPESVAIGDLDGDGKPDLAVANYGNDTISVLRNTSTNGNINFATKVDFTTGVDPASVAIGDLDGDGKADLTTANQGSDTASVLRNTSTNGNINFATKVDFTTGNLPESVAIGDIDGDGKPDLATANQSYSTVSVLRNTSTSGTINFVAKVDFSTGNQPVLVAIGDIDGDGKSDLTTANLIDSTVSVLRNTSTSGTINFATKVGFPTGNAPISVAIRDIDGDGKLDLVIANSDDDTVSVLRNSCTPSQASTTTMVSSSANPSVFGQSTTFTATVSSTSSGTPTGTVTFNIDGTNQTPVSLVNGQASFSVSSLSVASHSVTATYSGDNNFSASTSTTFTQTVSKANTSTSVSSTANPSVFGQSVTFTATVSASSPGSGSPTGMVQFKDGVTNLGSPVSLVNGQAQLSASSLSVTSHSITAVYSGDTNFNTSTSVALTQVVNKASTTTSLSANPTQIVYGQMVTLTATISVTSPGAGTTMGTVTFKDGATTLGTLTVTSSQAALTVAINNAGTRTITAIYSGDANFNGSTSNNVSLFSSTLDHNTIYVADTLNNRIQRSTDQGTSWKTVGNGVGIAVGQFNAPRGVTSNFADTVIFVADTGNNRVQGSTDGGVTWQVVAGGAKSSLLSQPSGVAYDEINNKLYIADTANSTILVVTNPTSASPIISVFAGASAGTAVGKFNQPQAIAVNLNGSVYVADTANNRIQVNSNGLSTGWTVLIAGGKTSNQVLAPKGVYVDNNGRIWVADTANNRIQVSINGVWSIFMSAGTAVGTVNSPEAVVVNLSGSVFIADTGNNRIQSKPSAGGTATVVGQAGLNVGQFNQPSGIR